ncbi:MAG TPA: glycoside hydrolase family 3 C-terminal domain-containing protein [Kiritimatiellia bacterium]|nr:glycoside hydrolase family 3 C-terminal domain-containing protein [Kiritimatiellia bacterium]
MRAIASRFSSLFLLSLLLTAKGWAADQEARIQELIDQMSLDDKIAMVSGEDPWMTHPIPRLGISSVKVADGPHGVRNGGKATCFPTGIGMAATWNPDLVRRVGVALAEETRGRGFDILLGPCVNICRTPLNGRNFEAFGEDPFLISRIAVAYVKGIQSRGVGTSTKHLACNNQERDRFSVNVRVDERVLREIYLPAFEAAVKEADTWTVMTAHNKVNGSYCSANDFLVNKVLKGEWDFRGFTVSDWGGVHDTVGAANGGQDLEMPGPAAQFGAKLKSAIEAGAVSVNTLDDKVRRILRVVVLVGALDPRPAGPVGGVDTPEHRTLAREAARECMTLLKNTNNVLPFDAKKIKKLAVIGPNADADSVGGGGSSRVTPFYFVTPLDGLRERCGKNIEIVYERGCSMANELDAVPAGVLFTSRTLKEAGLRAEYFANKDLSGTPAFTRIDPAVDFNWPDGPGEGLAADGFSVRWTGVLVAPMTGDFELGTYSDDGSRLFINGAMLVDNWGNHGPQTQAYHIQLRKGELVDLKMEYYQAGGGATAKLGWMGGDGGIQKAVAAAAQSDAAVVCVGLSAECEGEDRDRPDMKLPGKQAELIEAVMAANPRTIVVFIGGSPVVMNPWVDHVPAVVCAWYPGQECGHALADVLFGDVNPSGKMPVTFPKQLEDNPSAENYPGSDGVEDYAEGLLVGYRYYDTKNVEPQFPFGHGLSYTEFKYDHLKVDSVGRVVTFDVKNTGRRAGKEVAQLYIGDPKCSVERPVKELKAFRKIELLPGQQQTVRFQLDERALSFYDVATHRWVAEPGDFDVSIGSSSRDIRLKGTLTLSSSAKP